MKLFSNVTYFCLECPDESASEQYYCLSVGPVDAAIEVWISARGSGHCYLRLDFLAS